MTAVRIVETKIAKVACLLLFLGASLVLTGSTNTTAKTQPAAPMALVVTRTEAFPPNGIPPLTMISHDSAAVTRLYAATLSMPAFRPILAKGYSCPIDGGVSFRVEFKSDEHVLLLADAEAGGCNPLRIGGAGVYVLPLNEGDVRIADQAFWSLLAKAVGVPEPSLFAAARG